MDILRSIWEQLREVAMLLVPFIKGLFALAASILNIIADLLRRLVEFF